MTGEVVNRTYSRRDLCDLLGCSDVTLWRKIRDGKIRPPRDVAGLQRWTDGDVAELIGIETEEAA